MAKLIIEKNIPLPSKVYPATETLIVNGKVVSQKVTPVKPRRTLDSLTKEEFVNYYKKSKNIICL